MTQLPTYFAKETLDFPKTHWSLEQKMQISPVAKNTCQITIIIVDNFDNFDGSDQRCVMCS